MKNSVIAALAQQRMPQGIPIEKIPDDWKDGRKVLVYGPAEYQNGTTVCPEWRVAWFHEYWDCHETHVNKLKPTHFLPYPADPV